MARALSISDLARRFGLSRSTLLHYDRIGLLRAESRSESGYRRYGEAARERLARIVELRGAGLPLDQIKAVLEAGTPLELLLAKQLAELQTKMDELRAQQASARALLRLAQQQTEPLTKERWSAMFREAGLSEEDMHRWHCLFEAQLPQAHHDFLAFLGLDEREIARLREWSRAV